MVGRGSEGGRSTEAASVGASEGVSRTGVRETRTVGQGAGLDEDVSVSPLWSQP